MVATTDRLLKPYATKMKAVEGERAVIGTITTAIVDHDGDVLLPSGMDKSVFKTNPLMQLYHKGDQLPLGTWPKLVNDETPDGSGVSGKGVFIKRSPYHPPTVEWVPDTILWYFQQDVLKAFSIGFMIEDARDATDKDIRQFGKGARRIINRWKLLEVSVVNIPANRAALTQAVSKGLVKPSLLTEMWEIPSRPDLVVDPMESLLV